MPSSTILVGLCTGLLAAAAVSASQNILDLIANALIFVRVAFRVGAKVNDVAERLSPVRDAQINQSWSRLVVGVQKEASIAEVTRYNDRKVRRLQVESLSSAKYRAKIRLRLYHGLAMSI